MAIRTVSNYIRPSQRQYYIIDTLAYHSKNLYNVALYNTRQHYFEYCENTPIFQTVRPDIAINVTICVGSFLPYTRKKDFPYKDVSNYARSRQNENYPLLHSDVAQQTIRSVEEAYISYFALVRMYHSGDLADRPRLPRYLEKNGRYKLVFPASHITMRNGHVTLGMARMFKKKHGLTGKELTFKIPPQIQPNQIREVTIVPVHNGKVYKIEFAYTVPLQPTFLHPDQYLAIDLGVNNFATIIETATGTASIIDGTYLKSINRWYNKENARLQSIKDKQGLTEVFTHRQSRLLIRRNNRINEAMNRIVAYLIAFACEHGIGTIILPRWDGIKHQINHGAINNQNFVRIPYAAFRKKLRSKCELFGIQYDDSHDERYTSQVDALALDPIQKPWYGRTRLSRGDCTRAVPVP